MEVKTSEKHCQRMKKNHKNNKSFLWILRKLLVILRAKYNAQRESNFTQTLHLFEWTLHASGILFLYSIMKTLNIVDKFTTFCLSKP